MSELGHIDQSVALFVEMRQTLYKFLDRMLFSEKNDKTEKKINKPILTDALENGNKIFESQTSLFVEIGTTAGNFSLSRVLA